MTSGQRLAGKRVLITGTAGGQGAAAQTLFAREGAQVFGCDLQDGAAEATAKTLEDQGYAVHGATVDLADPDQASEWVKSAAAAMGGIDVLYNNASGFGFAPFEDMTLEMWRHVLLVELDIVFHVTSPAWSFLRDGGGSIVNVGSVSGLRGIGAIGQAGHSAAKGAVIALTRTLAAEGAVDGVRANAISPGFVVTPATDAAMDDNARDYMVSMHLLQRAGTSEDIAPLALYLASDESSWVTGQNIAIDGGWTAGFR
ncbi:SDR family NAD(P)-dependent oxidoreductase [Rhodococcus sp. JVH1]|uniref:SDR family NAD(P)-dependent oxidoreductase n=1 Tax=Rhodococcus sp. JVH1 TaxID=745408 RepID=UPI0002721348|nr:SDR family NAD(P)-dependent oxidoreductase [Rhodococcus sp. JVH1]EJI95742.1 short chain dehydrogenase family protein [Rhodococcus sp. JVH1]